MIKVIIFYII